MTYYLPFEDENILFSSDVDLLKEAFEHGEPVVLILDDSNKDRNTGFCRFAVTDDFAADNEFLKLVIARHKKMPLFITESKNLIIKELSMGDLDGVMQIFDNEELSLLKLPEDDKDIEKFYSNKDEAAVYLNNYIKSVYEFYGFGLWGIYSKGDSETLIGIAGFTPKYENDDYLLELGYIVNSEHRCRGIGFEACNAIILYGLDNIEFDRIIIVTDSNNLPSVRLANKLIDIYGNKLTLKLKE